MPNPLTAAEQHHRIHRQKRLKRAAATGICARILNAVIQLLSVALTLRYLGPDRYGMWVNLGSISIWLTLANLGLGAGLVVRLSRASVASDLAESSRLVSSTVLLVTAICLVLLCVSLALGWILPWHRVFNVASSIAAQEARPAAMVTILLVLISLPLSLAPAILVAYQRTDIVNIATAVASVLGLGAILLGVALEASVPWLLVALFLPQIIASAFLVLLVHRRRLVRFSIHHFDLGAARSMVSLGAAFLILQAYSMVIAQSGSFVIAQQFSSSDVTPYGVTTRVTMVFVGLLNAAFGALTPAYSEAYARGDFAWIRRSLVRSIWITVGAWIAFAGFFGIVGQWAISFWAGAEAVPSKLLLWCMLLFTLAHSLVMLVSFLLTGIGDMRSQLILGGIATLAFVPFAAVLTHPFGIAGVPLSQLLMTAVVLAPWLVIRAFRSTRQRYHGSGVS